MEEKVACMLQIIEEDGDSFAKRAEMYYRKRPELINYVEESYRAYRALAERYDHISGELQNANNSLAIVFPERAQFAIDEEEEGEDGSLNNNVKKLPKDPAEVQKENIPKVPKIPELPEIIGKGSPRKKMKPKKTKPSTSITSSSRMNKIEAIEEIDTLHKGILALQTEKEFVKSTYERSVTKYWEIENQITGMQEKVCSLQDEYGVGTIIEDNEARKLMASTALKSCQVTLTQLQEKQDKSLEEAKIESQRIKDCEKKLETLKVEFLRDSLDLQNQYEKEENVSKGKQEGLELQSIHFEESYGTSLTVTQLAEKIDELVHKTINLESAVSSQNALLKRLKSEIDEIEAHLKSLEEDKGSLIKHSSNLNEKLRELDQEFGRISALNRNVEDQNNNLQTHFTDISCNLDHLSKKLQCVKPEEALENTYSLQVEEGILLNVGPDKELKEPEVEEKKDEAQDLSLCVQDEEGKTEDGSLNIELLEQALEDEDVLNWKKLFLNGLEDREKIILGEYTSVLRNFKEAKRNLFELEKKNRDSLFEIMVQLRELKSDNAFKNEEIRSLRHKLRLLQTNGNENFETHLIQSKDSPQEMPFEGITEAKTIEPSVTGNSENLCNEMGEIETILLDEPHTLSTMEENFRTDIDDLLEENLKFWYKFSTSFHKLQTFQSAILDLQAEISKLKENKVLKGGTSPADQSLRSDALPIYKHLREIQSELKVWLEQNALLRDELQYRFSSLCSIQEEISRVSKSCLGNGEVDFTSYKAAKFQGEVLNMKQENNKVADELQGGLDHARGLQSEIEKTLSQLNEDFKLSGSNDRHIMHSTTRTRIPLRTFLFGVKTKKHRSSFFSCMTPPLHKPYKASKNGFSM